MLTRLMLSSDCIEHDISNNNRIFDSLTLSLQNACSYTQSYKDHFGISAKLFYSFADWETLMAMDMRAV